MKKKRMIMMMMISKPECVDEWDSNGDCEKFGRQGAAADSRWTSFNQVSKVRSRRGRMLMIMMEEGGSRTSQPTNKRKREKETEKKKKVMSHSRSLPLSTWLLIAFQWFELDKKKTRNDQWCSRASGSFHSSPHHIEFNAVCFSFVLNDKVISFDANIQSTYNRNPRVGHQIRSDLKKIPSCTH